MQTQANDTGRISRSPAVIAATHALRAQIGAARRAGKKIGVVPTMGALHAGHLSLVEASCRECAFTVVTIFVNPTQFGPNEDFRRYPRTLDADLQLLSSQPVDVVFTPTTETMYSPGHETFVDVGDVAVPWEGAHRPGHFRGVATVVLKLFNLVQPDAAFFGQKDFQQTLVVRRLARDLDLPVEIRVCPTVREADGLAMSSRNAYLSPQERQQALVISRSIACATRLVGGGERNAATVLDAMRRTFATEPDVQIDYIGLADPETLAPVRTIVGPTVAVIAARVGKTRLIDNVLLEPI